MSKHERDGLFSGIGRVIWGVIIVGVLAFCGLTALARCDSQPVPTPGPVQSHHP